LNDFLQSADPGTQKRRSTRIVQAVPITVTGTDALGQPFKERTTTVMVNCHGCKYQSKHYVPKNSMVKLDIPRPEGGPLSTQGRVVWVQRPRTVRELFQIGLEFDTPGNVWGIAFPPEDWNAAAAESPDLIAEFSMTMEVPEAPEPVALEPAASVSPQPLPPTPPPPIPSVPEKRAETPVAPFTIPAPPASSIASPPASPKAATPAPSIPVGASAPPAQGPSADNKIHVVPPPPLPGAPAPDPQATQAALARQVSQMVASAKENLDKTLRRGAEQAINEEMTVARQRLDAQLHETVEKAIKVSMDRVSESAVKKVVQQATERTTAIVEEARKATESSTAQLDERVRHAVQQAVSQAAEQAALQAAQQTATLNLKQSVEEAVERALRDRAAATPSLEILSSPEAAQNHLDQWRRNLEETAQTVRGKTLEQAQADANTAAQQWNAEFETALTSASQKLGDKLAVASQAALTQAEQDAAARVEALHASLREASRAALVQAEQDASSRAQTLRSSLDEAIAGAAATIEAVGAGLQHERHRAEETKVQLQEAVQNSLRQSRQQLEELLTAQQQEMSRKADQVIADRAQQMEPALQTSAQKILERVSIELEQQVTPRLEQVHRAVSELEQAERRAEQTKHHVQEQIQHTAEEVTHLQHAVHSQVQRASEQVTHLQHAVHSQLQQASEQVTHLQEIVRDQVQQTAQQVAQLQDEVSAQMQLATDRADRLQDTIREQTLQASEQAIQDAVARLHSETSRVPGEVEQACREVASKIEEEIQQRSTEMQHQTYESLLKASDWYQKKAHSTMQASLEKAVEQSSTALRDRAAEVSSLLASELDHYRRTYLEHSTAQIEDSAKEIVTRQRDKMNETSQMAGASFSDQVHRVTSESLKRFEQASREALEKARSDMEFGREGALAEYQKTLDERMMRGVEQAGVHLQSQLIPLVEEWEARREAEKKDWMEQLKKTNEESIEAYKARLENASNSWLLASATTLGQHSQAVLDTIAKAAEKRLRETCSEVLGTMGDTLKARLVGLSSDFNTEEDDEFPPKKK
jgi:PilZ domain